MNEIQHTEQVIKREITKVERETLAATKTLTNTKRYSRFLRILGPGLVTGAADDDPSGIATYSQTGAMFGFSLLWSFPLMYPLLLAVQESCSRIGAVTGKGLAAVIKDNYSKPLLYMSVLLVVAANTINIGADLGAMAATTQLLVPLPFAPIAITYALIIIALEIFVPYKSYARILKWLSFCLFAYPITAFLIGPSWREIFAATFNMRPSLSFDQMYILVGIIGTTISPYLFFWDTSQVVEEEIEKRRLKANQDTPKLTKRFLTNLRIDNFVGMSMASATAWFIVIVCAAVLFSTGTTEINSAADAARALEPLVQNFPNAGFVAKLIFSVGVIGLGLLAIPTLAGSASYAVSETLGWHEGLRFKFRRAAGFYSVIIVATLAGLTINFLGIDPIKALVATAVFNGIAAIPLLWMIARVGSNEKIMGEYRNSSLSNFGVRTAFVATLLAAFILFYALLTGQA